MENRRCLFCTVPISVTHLGIDACRACAAFFKRTVIAGRRYPCRRGDKKCVIRKHEKYMCVGCGYEKCLEVGMIYLPPPMKLMRKEKEMAAFKSPNTSSTSSTSPPAESLIERIGAEYRAMNDRRLLFEKEYVALHNLKLCDHTTEEAYVATFASSWDMFPVKVSELWKLFIAVFPSVNKFHWDDQRELFRMCMPQFILLDGFYITMRIFGRLNRFMMNSSITCIDIETPEGWFDENNERPNLKEIKRSFGGYFFDQMVLMGPSFEKADICDSERSEILALLVCESDADSEFADRFQPFLYEIRTEILHDLRRFYNEDMGLIEYSTRLGNLLTICHTLREGQVQFQEFFRMQATLFDTTGNLIQQLCFLKI